MRIFYIATHFICYDGQNLKKLAYTYTKAKYNVNLLMLYEFDTIPVISTKDNPEMFPVVSFEIVCGNFLANLTKEHIFGVLEFQWTHSVWLYNHTVRHFIHIEVVRILNDKSKRLHFDESSWKYFCFWGLYKFHNHRVL